MKTAFVSGNFNVLHPGHLRLLRFAKEVCERLVVGVWSDRYAGLDSHIPEHLRLEGVQSNGWVDEAFLLDEPIEEVLRRMKPDVVVKGKEHEKQINPEESIVLEYGGTLLFSSGEVTFSSLELIQEQIKESGRAGVEFPKEFTQRHGISKHGLALILERINKLRVVVVGDLIVDEYVTCEPLGMSQEDASIVVTPIDSQRFLGGAGIVAAHASGIGASVRFFAVAGNDLVRDFAINELNKSGTVSRIFTDPSRPTTLKQRYRADEKTLLRVSHLHQSTIGSELQQNCFDEIASTLPETDVLVFSDFNYGCLPQELVDNLIVQGSRHGVYMAADSQSSSQLGDVARFKGMHLLTPTEREARLSLRSQEDGLVVLGEKLSELAEAEHLFLKLGSEGMMLHVRENGEIRSDRIPALNPHPRDVAGAGDSLLIMSILALRVGASAWEAACLGSIAAAIQVGRVGNSPLSLNDLTDELIA